MQNKKLFDFCSRDDIAKNIEDIISLENKRRIFNFSRESFKTNDLTECDRRILYKAFGEKFDETYDVSKLIIEKDFQESIRNKWLSFFKNSIKFRLIDEKLVVADCNYNLVGNVDGVLKIGDCKLTLLVKAVTLENFEKIKERGCSRKHILEAMMNMWLAEIKDGIILYENKNTSEILIYHVSLYSQIIEACKKKCLKILKFKMKGELSNRLYENQDSLECSICEFKNKCWNI